MTEAATPRHQEKAHTAEIPFGSVNYSIIGEASTEHNPIVFISGQGNDRVYAIDLANLLAEKGHRQVLIFDQPEYDEKVPGWVKRDEDSTLAFHAEAILAACQDAGWIGKDKTVDAIGYSLGGLVAEKVQKLAKERGIGSFDQDNGSRLALVAPAGSNSRENLTRLGGRWLTGYQPKTIIEAPLLKALDPTGAHRKAVLKNVLHDLNKTIGELKFMSRQKIDYDKLGEALLVIYPEDKMFPENQKAIKSKEKGLINQLTNKELPIVIATPVDAGSVALKGMDLWLTKAWLKGSRARRNFALSNRGAGHNELTDNPKRTANLILNYFDYGGGGPVVRPKKPEY